MAMQVASQLQDFMVSSHQQPQHSIANGVQIHPKQLHFSSLEACLLIDFIIIKHVHIILQLYLGHNESVK